MPRHMQNSFVWQTINISISILTIRIIESTDVVLVFAGDAMQYRYGKSNAHRNTIEWHLWHRRKGQNKGKMSWDKLIWLRKHALIKPPASHWLDLIKTTTKTSQVKSGEQPCIFITLCSVYHFITIRARSASSPHMRSHTHTQTKSPSIQ